MVPPSRLYCALRVPGLQWYRGGGTGLQGKELGLQFAERRADSSSENDLPNHILNWETHPLPQNNHIHRSAVRG
jgi:hypothetical protein